MIVVERESGGDGKNKGREACQQEMTAPSKHSN